MVVPTSEKTACLTHVSGIFRFESMSEARAVRGEKRLKVSIAVGG